MNETASLVIRPARREDIRAIVEVLADDRLGQEREDLSEPLNPAYLAAFEAIEASANELLVVADLDGRVVGCMQITFLPGLSRKGMWRGQIESVRVDSSMRGTGLGRRMMGWALEECRRRKCGLVQLTSDRSRTDAHRFYENLGFEMSHVGMKIILD
jgi:GNAT superfamily N-acetyltransferase